MFLTMVLDPFDHPHPIGIDESFNGPRWSVIHVILSRKGKSRLRILTCHLSENTRNALQICDCSANTMKKANSVVALRSLADVFFFCCFARKLTPGKNYWRQGKKEKKKKGHQIFTVNVVIPPGLSDGSALLHFSTLPELGRFLVTT